MPRGYTKGHAKAPGSGRKKGQSNKITEEVRKLAKSHGPAVIKELGRLAVEAEDERARVEAGKVILDRAYGKASPLPLADDGNPQAFRVIITGDDAKL